MQIGLEDDLEQGFGNLSDGCTRWECQTWEPGKHRPTHPQLVDRQGYWTCPKCGGSYGAVKESQ